MAIIGTFARDDADFFGVIRTLTFTASVTIEPIAEKRGEKSPDYRVYCQSSGPGEIGAAWKKNRDGKDILSVRIDDPFLAAPLDCRLVENPADENYNLIWERKR